MKIEVDLTSFHEWETERIIRVMAGVETAAYKRQGQPWMVKTVRCNMCGECCMNLGENFPLGTIEGRCVYLEKEVGDNPRWLCKHPAGRPYGCSVIDPDKDYCCIEYEAVE